MKSRLILLALGVIGVIANPVSKQTIADDNKNPVQSESIESQTKHEESTLNNDDEQKKDETINELEPFIVTDDTNGDGKVNFIFEESVIAPINSPTAAIDDRPISYDLPIPINNKQIPFDVGPTTDDGAMTLSVAHNPDEISQSSDDVVPNLNDDNPLLINIAPQIPEEFHDDFPLNQIPYRDAALNTIQDEIMETAAGFVPTPLVFRRKQKPRRRFATRRHFRPNPFKRKFHFFYPYYGFYHPSSLRFY